MSTIKKPPADHLAQVIRTLLQGGTLPPADSAAFGEIQTLTGQLVRGGDAGLRRFAVLVLGAFIDLGGAHVTTAQVLADFGRDAFGGDRGQV